MTNPDSIRRRQAARQHEINHKPREYDEFRETLAAPVPIPNQTYRSEIDLTSIQNTFFEQVIRYAAGLLALLLGVRFITSLFSTNPANGFVGAVHGLTNWLVAPFQGLAAAPANHHGFFDLPAIAAFIVAWALAWMVIRLLRPRL